MATYNETAAITFTLVGATTEAITEYTEDVTVSVPVDITISDALIYHETNAVVAVPVDIVGWDDIPNAEYATVVIPISITVSDVVGMEELNLEVVLPVEVTVTDAGRANETGAEMTVPVSVTITDTIIYDERDAEVAIPVSITVAEVFSHVENVTIEVPIDFDALDLHTLPMHVEPSTSTTRRLSWSGGPPGALFWVIVDGMVLLETYDHSILINAAHDIRASLMLVVAEGLDQDHVEGWLPSPLDRVELNWTDIDVDTSEVYRKLGAGDFAVVDEVIGMYFEDGVLPDGIYTYKVTGTDPEGDSSTSNEAAVTIDSTPAPPTGIAYVWNAETQTLDITWTASVSADLDEHVMYGSDGANTLNLEDAPIDDGLDEAYQQVFTTETGRYVYLVRARDTDGKEEQHLQEMLSLYFEDGLLSGKPAEPQSVQAVPSAGGKVTVTWVYFPGGESGGASPCIAMEARIYSDDGSGVVDYSSPMDVQAMTRPTTPLEMSWVSAVLVDEQEYRFVVRIATAAHPAGIESQNTEECTAIPNSDVPATATLTAEVI